MLIKRADELKYSEQTPKQVFLDRRKFLAGASLAAGAALAGAKLWNLLDPPARAQASTKLSGVVKSSYRLDESQTPYEDATHYNNYYEFGTDKSDPARNAQNFRTSPWTVTVDGEVKKPRKLSFDDILKIAPLEERVYRHRCVETWSMIVPWIGYSFSALAKLVEPTPKARYVAFETYYNEGQMPLGSHAGIPLPYVDGLRLDEAMHPLALLCVGMYGETLPNQNGSPVRMILPWKYGFKSIKSLVRIRFVKDQPPVTWNLANSREYGFYSNVNPTVDHPRWSQAKERRLGEFFKRPTLMFNGYADQVGGLYSGMDLRKYF